MFDYFKIVCGVFFFVPDTEIEISAMVQKQDPSQTNGEGKSAES